MHVSPVGPLPADLQRRIDAIFARTPAVVSLAGIDLQTGERWELEGDRPFPAAQLSALPLLIDAFDAAQRDELDLAPLRTLMARSVLECDGEALSRLAERLDKELAPTVSARALLEQLAALEADHPLWSLLEWEGDRTKFPRRLPRLPMAYKAADRCDPPLAHAAGRLGGPDGVLLVVLSQGDAEKGNSLVGRIAKAVWDTHQDRTEQHRNLDDLLARTRETRIPDGRLGVWNVTTRWEAGTLLSVGETTLPQTLLPHPADQARLTTLPAEPAVVTAPVLNLRREPRHGAELVSQAPMGTALTVLKRPEGEWWLVHAPDGYVAWARSSNVRLGAREGEELRILPTVVVATRADEAGTVALAAGSRLRILDRGPEAWLAETPEGCRVRVPADAALAASEIPALWADPAGLGPRAIAMADAWRGIPYLWGGKSGWGLDCSGLTQLVYELLGIGMPRDADQQARALPPVARWEELIPGDLLFYPGHVGLWAGDGTVIHASSPRGGVVREALSTVGWLRERCTSMGRPVLPR